MDIHINAEQIAFIGRLLLILVAAAIVVTKAIDALKAAGKINAESAGEWNQAVSFGVSLTMFAIKWIGIDGQVPAAQQLGAEIAAVLVTTYSVAAAAKLIHKLVNWLEVHKVIEAPKAQPPAMGV